MFFFLFATVLLLVDFYGYDRISNTYLVQALESGEVKENIFIGSSKLKWSIIDSLLSEESTILAEGGQFAFASVGVLMKLNEHHLLDRRTIYLDLQEANEISSGYGQWWYFSETFIRYRYANYSDYPLEHWPAITARVVRDITHFGPNARQKFGWKPLEKSVSHLNAAADRDSLEAFKKEFDNCLVPLPVIYRNSLLRINTLFRKVEAQTNCRIIVIIPPYPKSGCLSDYLKIFGKGNVIDLTQVSLEYGDFHDNSHVNGSGAVKLTEYLNSVMGEVPE
ncbi:MULTISPECIES: hypothetical protein [unclassified Imperialibacter]|uniref:hypothetical protein n=1 Tax=unclassified Imperialibacter TaxID=2629706 RepID=UPI0012567EF6|nr:MULTISPECIES: hypothetical protein [unclassified Imperialibacter]CAD5253052.1 hypothetical protein IMPERIA89_170118 [Imperialibacter sp. 89]CAD5261239.1 hypothetical protein IMPERIA75_260118 [Imperialibacter sp. 75]VVT03527.1 hypothetical protein IMPR6_140055 [Imperialibacter sp. EC-SDR9]